MKTTDEEKIIYDTDLYDRDFYLEYIVDDSERFADELEAYRESGEVNWELLSELENAYLEEDMHCLAGYLDGGKRNPNAGNHLVVRGSVGRWNGCRTGLSVFGSFDELISGRNSLFGDCRVDRVWEQDGSLFLRGSHHDGRVDVEVRQLTDDGDGLVYKMDEDMCICGEIQLPKKEGYENVRVYAEGDENEFFHDVWNIPSLCSKPRYLENEFGA